MDGRGVPQKAVRPTFARLPRLLSPLVRAPTTLAASLGVLVAATAAVGCAPSATLKIVSPKSRYTIVRYCLVETVGPDNRSMVVESPPEPDEVQTLSLRPGKALLRFRTCRNLCGPPVGPVSWELPVDVKADQTYRIEIRQHPSLGIEGGENPVKLCLTEGEATEPTVCDLQFCHFPRG